MSIDRRVKYSKKVLNESLIKFLQKKPLARITIKEICEDADINRSTYYAHFLDPYDQLDKLEKEIFNGMTEYVDSIANNSLDKNIQETIIKSILQYIKDNETIFKALFQNGELNFQKNNLKYFATRLFNNDVADFKDIDLKYIYCATGSYAIIYSWIVYDLKIGVDDLAKVIINQNLGVK